MDYYYSSLDTPSLGYSAASASATSSEETSTQSNTARANAGKRPKIRYNPLTSISRHEKLKYYRPGGYHPIHIGDRLGESGRFAVMRKLGYGTFGMVWMCWDNVFRKARAVKVMRAKESHEAYENEVGLLARLSEAGGQVSVEDAYENHLAAPLEHFWQDGPNGRHLCIVMPVLGPNITWAKTIGDVDFLKDVCSQITGGLAFLHSRGMAHGDLHHGNILIHTTFSDLNEHEIDSLNLKPFRTEPLVAEGLYGPGPHAPAYICECFDWRELDPKYLKKEIAIIDFGTSFKSSEPPDYQTIHTSLRAPENFFGDFPSQASDLWALGCAMMNILGSVNPFIEEREDRPPVPLWEDALGPLPQLYRPQWIGFKWSLGEWDYDAEGFDTEPISMSSDQLAMVKNSRLEEFGSEDAIFECLVRPTNLRFQGSEQTEAWSLPSWELDSAVSLVRSLFTYEPQHRMPASKLLGHPFFTKRKTLPLPSSSSSTRRPHQELQPSENQPGGQSSRDALDEEDLPVRGGGAVDARDADAAEEEEADLGGELGHGVH